MREFCRSEGPVALEVRAGFVRVCLDEVRRLEVPNVVAAAAIFLELAASRGGRKEENPGYAEVS